MVSTKHFFALLYVTMMAGMCLGSSVLAEDFIPAKKIALMPEASRAQEQDSFGSAVLLMEDFSVVGAPTTHNNQGAVYLFSMHGGAQQILKNSTKLSARFGASLTADSGILAVGAPSENLNAATISTGAVYLYKQNEQGQWTLLQRLATNDAMAGDFFGVSLALQGADLFVGAHLQDGKGIDSGAVYHFRQQHDGTFRQHKKLIPASLKAGALFGNALAIDGNTLAIAAYGYDGKSPGGGAVYMYEKTGDSWKPSVKLEASKRKAFSEFGWSIDLKGNTLAVSAPYEDKSGMHAGVVYVFNRADAKQDWQFGSRLRYQDDEWKQRFGANVVLSDKKLLVSAPYGVAYLFKNKSGEWQQAEKLVAAIPYADNMFGRAMDMRGETVLIGVPSTKGNRTGEAYLFPNIQ